jgi:hypothetical protein
MRAQSDYRGLLHLSTLLVVVQNVRRKDTINIYVVSFCIVWNAFDLVYA